MSKYKAQEKYDALNTRRYSLKVNLKTENEIYQKLKNLDNVQGYIKRLIRQDLEKEKQGL